ncbi:acyltransferase family protein [Aurantiacibacter sp. D1-12]|uniref:acyltransferase family protein n=1 Tax=Aurantiacibacter sp. D1-12 TaxID=2993658 RepID=UPI00237C79C9|nr:acyltransferase [Aurantiacibacter sp. D1-12]MDE1467454.1 acyltransferase [Aurantiacibacter sp. D1-12]
MEYEGEHRFGPLLASRLTGRNNNLNLVRILAAMAVIVSHAFVLTSGDPFADPLHAPLGTSIGFLAVAVFFAISGLLIARSFDRRASIWHFGLARVLRLWPALIVAVMLTAFVLGPALSQLSPDRYFSARETWAYVPTNLALVARQDALPGLFADNPYPHAVNGSLWSLFYEVACYLGLTLIGLLGLLRKQWSVIALVIGGAAAHVIATTSVGSGPIGYRLDLLAEIGFAFALGMAAFIARDRLRLSWKAAALAWLAVALLWLTPLVQTALITALSYSVLVFGFATRNRLLRYNALGDYSYGTYIYAFPIQQALIQLFPGQTALQNMALAIPVTLLFAITSWHVIERPALASSRPLADRLASSKKS